MKFSRLALYMMVLSASPTLLFAQYSTISGSVFTKEPAGSPNAWPSERTLTESSVESLPETGNLSSILSNTEGSVVTEWFDVAGMHSYRPLLIGVHGSSWTQNQATLNGVPINHPLGDGMLFLPDLSALDSVTYSIGSSPSFNMGPGAHFSMISKTGERQLHGEAYSFLQCGALQKHPRAGE